MAEQTFIMVKPDVVQRGLVDQIIYRFEKKGFTLRGLKLRQYEDLSARAFFGCLVEYIISGPVVAMVWDHKGVVTTGRKMIGVTDLSESALGAIRGDFSVEIGRNVIHVGDTIENGRKEITLWFPDGFVNWESSLEPWICEYIISFAFDPEFVFV